MKAPSSPSCPRTGYYRFSGRQKEYLSMKTIRVYRLHPSPSLFRRLTEAHREAARVWNRCMELHKQARTEHTSWPGRDILQKATKGGFALQSQSVQMVVHAFLANIDTTRQLRKDHPEMRVNDPHLERTQGGGLSSLH